MWRVVEEFERLLWVKCVAITEEEVQSEGGVFRGSKQCGRHWHPACGRGESWGDTGTGIGEVARSLERRTEESRLVL